MTRRDAITVDDLKRFKTFSEYTFGDGTRNEAKFKHLREELNEAEENPTDTVEWVDIVLLAIDGAIRNGATPQDFIDAYHAKFERNLARTWPDYRDMPEGEVVKHQADVHEECPADDRVADPSWTEFSWPDWIPAHIRDRIENFWSKDSGLGPQDRSASEIRHNTPPLGTVVTLPRVVNPFTNNTPGMSTGRFVYAWSDHAYLVGRDGETHAVFFSEALLIGQ